MITKKQIEHIIKRYHIKLDRYTYRDGVVDVRGSVMLTDTALHKLPIKFGRVDGDFYCHGNKLQTLKGAPAIVGGDFNCANNRLTSLKEAPKQVGGNFSCHENALTTLKGSPQHIFGNFNAFLNKLTTLEGAPKIVEKNCSLFENQLISLKYGPVYVGGSFHITGNQLNNLVGIPQYIGNILSIDNLATLYTGNQKCQVKSVKIEIKKKRHKTARSLPRIVIEKSGLLSPIFFYMPYLDIFSADGTFNQSNFQDIIFDIETGLR